MADEHQPERRTARLRRDFNDIARSPDGRVSEAKLWSSAGKAAALFLLVRHAESVIESWDVLAVLLLVLIAPDLFKKFIAVRYPQTTQK